MRERSEMPSRQCCTIDTGKQGGLAGAALRKSLQAQIRVDYSESESLLRVIGMTLQGEITAREHPSKAREIQRVKGILWAFRTDAYAIDKKEIHRTMW